MLSVFDTPKYTNRVVNARELEIDAAVLPQSSITITFNMISRIICSALYFTLENDQKQRKQQLARGPNHVTTLSPDCPLTQITATWFDPGVSLSVVCFKSKFRPRALQRLRVSTKKVPKQRSGSVFILVSFLGRNYRRRSFTRFFKSADISTFARLDSCKAQSGINYCQ